MRLPLAHGGTRLQSQRLSHPITSLQLFHVPQAQSQAARRAACSRRQSACRAQAGHQSDLLLDSEPSSSQLWTPGQPEHDTHSVVDETWGLTPRQVQALGLTGPSASFRAEPDPASLSARAHYGGYKPFDVRGEVTTATALETTMAARSGRSPPPDLPSLLLDGRIVYLGMPITAKVTELIICELLWLNYSNPESPLNIYVHSIGTQTQFHQAIAFETDAYAIMDTLAYIRPKVYTLVIGQAFGNAAMIVASGAKGCRFATPNSRLMTAPPRLNRNFGSTKNIMIRANELENNTQTYVKFMARATGKDPVEVRKDVGRNRYFSAQQAMDYGLIDRISTPLDLETVERKDYEGRMQAQQNASRTSRRVPAGAGAGGGGGGPETGF